LHDRIDLEIEKAKILAEPDFLAGERDVIRELRAYNEYKLRNPFYRLPPVPSGDPSYEVYFEVGWDFREILIATFGKATCRRCKRE
jgi:hypothetical protein